MCECVWEGWIWVARVRRRGEGVRMRGGERDVAVLGVEGVWSGDGGDCCGGVDVMYWRCVVDCVICGVEDFGIGRAGVRARVRGGVG